VHLERRHVPLTECSRHRRQSSRRRIRLLQLVADTRMRGVTRFCGRRRRDGRSRQRVIIDDGDLSLSLFSAATGRHGGCWLATLPKGLGDVCRSPLGVTHFLLVLVTHTHTHTHTHTEKKGGAADQFTFSRKEGREFRKKLTASQGPRSSKTLSTSKNVAAARNFLAVFRVAAPRRSSLSAEANTLRAKSSTYAEDALSTVMASDVPTA
jgi:hypothetical protein